jgi:hypothetical protein
MPEEATFISHGVTCITTQGSKEILYISTSDQLIILLEEDQTGFGRGNGEMRHQRVNLSKNDVRVLRDYLKRDDVSRWLDS